MRCSTKVTLGLHSEGEKSMRLENFSFIMLRTRPTTPNGSSFSRFLLLDKPGPPPQPNSLRRAPQLKPKESSISSIWFCLVASVSARLICGSSFLISGVANVTRLSFVGRSTSSKSALLNRFVTLRGCCGEDVEQTDELADREKARVDMVKALRLHGLY